MTWSDVVTSSSGNYASAMTELGGVKDLKDPIAQQAALMKLGETLAGIRAVAEAAGNQQKADADLVMDAARHMAT